MSIVSDLFSAVTSTKTQFEKANADLYQVDHRKFAVQHCDSKAAARRANLDAAKRRQGLISGLEKLAGIEGTGVVQEALDTIVSATHVGGTEWERIVDAGAEGILTSVLGDQGTKLITGVLNDITPHGVNTAVNSAKQIYDKVKGRDLDWKDIPQYVSDFKNLYEVGKNVLDPFFENNAPSTEPVVACSASPYAMDLISLGTKFKFLFVVEFHFNPAYQKLVDVSPAYVVKTADRPSIQYEYEDINMYNFHTKVAKRSSFAPLTMSFYDDEQNHATAFYNAMMRLMSPVTNVATSFFLEEDGMNFGDLKNTQIGRDAETQGIAAYQHSASIGPMLGTNTSIIEAITLHHVYMGGKRVNRYTFHRPRVINMTLDQMDMTAGEVSELRLEFAYDSIEITNNIDTALSGRSDSRIDNVPGIRHPIGGHGVYDPGQTIAAAATEAPSGLAELYADGRAYVEGFVSGATKMAGDAYTSVANGAKGLWTSITGGAPTTPEPVDWSARAKSLQQAIDEAGLKGTVKVLTYNE